MRTPSLRPTFPRLVSHVLVTVLVPTLACGGPTDGVVTAGRATIATHGATTTITQDTSRAIIQWKDFSIGSGELTRFLQPDASSAVLNRVTGGNPSQLLGRLEANGSVFVINPNGVLVGREGVIATGGTFAASTRELSDAAFLRGDRDLAFSGHSAAGIENLGTITSANGDAILVGRTVRHAGAIDAPRGTAALAAGDEVLLQRQSDDTLRVRFTVPGTTGTTAATGVDHSGVVRAAQAELAASGGDLYALAVKTSGTIQATGIEERGGRIFLTAERGGSIEATGALRATRSGTGAAATGGDVIVLAGGHTKFSGQIETGQSGFAEVSGRGTLDFTGLVNTRGGRLLLDPTDFTIDDAQLATISAQLANQAVTIYASGNIFYTANGSATVGLFPVTGRGYNLTFNADEGITFAAGSRLNLTGAAADLQLYANTGNITIGDGAVISMTGGQALLRASRDITLGASASVTFSSGGRFLAVADSSATTGTGPFTSVPQDRVGRLTLGSGATLNAATVQLFAVKPADFVNTSSYTPGAPTYNTVDSAVTLTTAGSGLWFQSNSSGTFGSNPSTLTITADNQSKTYGAALPTFTASYAGLINGDTSSVVTGLQFSTTATLGSNVGTYAITPFGASAPSTYTLAYVNGTLTVNPAALTIAATNATKVYGASLPVFSATYTGLVNGDTSGVVTGLQLTTTATASSSVASYPITASGASASNYTITHQSGTLSVTKAPLSIRADDQNKTYGAALPAFTSTFTGLVNGDTSATAVSGLQLTTAATASSGVGTFAITPGGATSANYTLSYLPGTLTIDRAPLSIRADDFSRPAGSALPIFTATYNGLVNGDTSAAVTGLSFATTATTTSPAGTYPITPSGATAANYTLSFVPGVLTLTGNLATSLTLQAANAARLYGDANPTFSLLPPLGLLSGDSVTSVQFATTATLGSNVGTYTITPSNAVIASPSSNAYNISYLPGTLTVNRAPLVVQAPNASVFYRDALGNLPVTVSGLKNGDPALGVVDRLFNALSTTANTNSVPGTYPITANVNLTSPNYTLSFVPGTLTINPAPLTLRIGDFTRAYGDDNPTLTAALLGAKGPDSPASLVSYSLTTAASRTSNVGNFPITATASLLSTNYTLTVQPGTASVIPAVLTVRPPDTRKTYGDPLATLAAPVVTGLKNNDTAAAVVNPGSSTTTATDLAVAAGTYAITAVGAQALSPNYTLSVQPGTLTVERAPLTVRAADATRPVGEPNPAFTATYTGFKLGESTAVLGNIGISTTATLNSPAGLYPITPTATSPNYAITFIPGTLSLGEALARQLTLQAADVTRFYGQNNPTLTLLPPLGFAPGDSLTSVKFATTATVGSNVGTYTITPFDAVLSRPSGADYAINYVPGTLTINPQVLRFQLNSFLASDYGDPLASPFFAITSPTAKNIPASGFGLNGIRNGATVAVDEVSVQLSSFGLGLPDGRLNAGVYRTAGTLGTLLTNGVANPNYRLELGDVVNYEVRRREFIVNIAGTTSTYGQDVAQSAVAFTTQRNFPGTVGLLPGDTLANAFTTYGFSLPVGSTGAGTHRITLSGFERPDSNYRFMGFIAGTATVLPATLTLLPQPGRVTFGQTTGNFTYTLSGFVNDFDRELLTGAPDFHVDTFGQRLGITVGTLSHPNYVVGPVGVAPLQVDPVPLTIRPFASARIVGGEVPRPFLSFEGFKFGETSTTPRLLPYLANPSFYFVPRVPDGARTGTFELHVGNRYGTGIFGYTFDFQPGVLYQQEIIPATMQFQGNADTFTRIDVTGARLSGGTIRAYTPEFFGIPAAFSSQYRAIIEHYHRVNGLTWDGDAVGWLERNGGNVELIGRMTGSVAAVIGDLAGRSRGSTLSFEDQAFLDYMQEKIRSEKMAATAAAYNDYLAWKIDAERITDTQGPNLLTAINYGWDRVPPESYLQRAQSGFDIAPETFFTWATMMAQLGKPEIIGNAMAAAVRDAEAKGESAAAVISSMSAGLAAAGMTQGAFNSIMPFVAQSAARTAQDAFLTASTARAAAQAAAQAASQTTTGWVPGVVGLASDVSNATRTAITTAITPIAEASGGTTTGLNAARAAITSAAVSSIAVGVITTVAGVILNKALDDVVKITMTENEMGASVLRAAQPPPLQQMAGDGSLLLYLAKFSSEQIEQRERYTEAGAATATQPNSLITLPSP